MPVSYTGNVLRDESPVRHAFEAGMAARWPHADVRAPVGDALRGAALLARLAPELEPVRGVLWRSR